MAHTTHTPQRVSFNQLLAIFACSAIALLTPIAATVFTVMDDLWSIAVWIAVLLWALLFFLVWNNEPERWVAASILVMTIGQVIANINELHYCSGALAFVIGAIGVFTTVFTILDD